jgi:hypothetical protein
MALTSNAAYKVAVNGLGSTTYVVTLSKSSITEAETKAAIKAAVEEGNSVAGVIVDTNVITVALQGKGITAGSDYGATGVTSALVYTFA